MIPYDDLVAALQQWRARQGLPVAMGTGGSGGTAMPGSGPHGKAGSGPNVQAARADSVVDDAEVLEEEAYEGNDVEPTTMGEAPERPTESDMGGGGREDW